MTMFPNHLYPTKYLNFTTTLQQIKQQIILLFCFSVYGQYVLSRRRK